MIPRRAGGKMDLLRFLPTREDDSKEIYND